jgi:hypothetical protein
VPGLDENDLIRQIEPSTQHKKADQSDWTCKIYSLPTDAIGDPTRYAANLHPYQCARHPTLEKNYFIIADEPNFLQEGVVIVNIDWDGKVSGKIKKQLLDIGQSLLVQTHRAEVPETASYAAVGTLCMLALGYQKWQPKVKQFAVYYPNTSDANIKLAMTTDPRWVKRTERSVSRLVVLYFLTRSRRVVGTGLLLFGDMWRVASDGDSFLPLFTCISFCMMIKLCQRTTRSDLLDGDMQLVENLAQEYRSKVSTIKEIASQAHKVLTDVVDGKLE